MFERFGEFDSPEELNRAAAAQLKEGDEEAVCLMAEENGIDREDAQDYIDGAASELASPLMAALGKLSVEGKDLSPYGIMEDWLVYVRARCQEDPAMCAAVRRKGKSLRGCVAALLAWSLKNAREVDGEILRQCNIAYKVTLGIPGIAQAKKIITEYYLGGRP